MILNQAHKEFSELGWILTTRLNPSNQPPQINLLPPLQIK